MSTWRELQADKRMVAALDAAGPRPPNSAERRDKNNWSNRFADASARSLAAELRARKELSKFDVLPTTEGKSEPVIAKRPGEKGKKVDVAVAGLGTGLQISMSLKGGNFLDPKQGYGKNLTGRLYELRSEAKVVHEHHPHALIICVYYFPIGATMDGRLRSTLAKAVEKLRKVTERVHTFADFDKVDWSVIGLYVPEEEAHGFRPGVCRYFDVLTDPPKLGRPRVEDTLSMRQFVSKIITRYKGTEIEYGEPERD